MTNGGKAVGDIMHDVQSFDGNKQNFCKKP